MIAKLREKANGFGGDDRAVSPVVGVALLIAITVILAAVIGFVVLNTTDAQNAASTDARMSFSGGASGLTVAHEGGDSIDKNNIVVKNNGTDLNDTDYSFTGSGDFSTGESISIDGTAVGSGDRIVVVYEDPNSDRETQLASYVVE